jgi:uncharacterized protein (DUF1778 family)
LAERDRNPGDSQVRDCCTVCRRDEEARRASRRRRSNAILVNGGESVRLVLYAQMAYNRHVSETKTQRVHLRVAASDDELFRNAAAATHESLSEFLVESGRERAERVLADRTRFMLALTDWRAFTAALDRPAREIRAVVELFRRPRPD